MGRRPNSFQKREKCDVVIRRVAAAFLSHKSSLVRRAMSPSIEMNPVQFVGTYNVHKYYDVSDAYVACMRLIKIKIV